MSDDEPKYANIPAMRPEDARSGRQKDPDESDDAPRIRVKDLAKRFEEINRQPPVPSKPPKRVGKFRIVNGNSDPVRCGIARRKSSLKRRSQSNHEIPQLRGNSSRKSLSSSASRAVSRESLVSIHSLQRIKDNATRSMTVSPAIRGVKPPPPVKPARLRSTPSPAKEIPSSSIFRNPKKEIPSNENPAVLLTVRTLPRPVKAPPPAPANQIERDSTRNQVPPPQPPAKPPSKARLNRRSSLLKNSKSPDRYASTDSIYQVLDDSYDTMMPTFSRSNDFVPRVPDLPPPPLPEFKREPPSSRPPLPPPSFSSQDLTRESDRQHVHDKETSRPSSSLTIPTMSCHPGPSSSTSSDEPNLYARDNEEEDFYEEIGVDVKLRDCSSASCSTSSDYVTSIYCAGGETVKCSMSSSCPCPSCDSRTKLTQSTNDPNIFSQNPKRSKYPSATLGRKSKRPMSTLEFDKLIKFKSDFHLNLSKKMDQLRKKVSSDRSRRAFSRCTLNADQLTTDAVNNPDDEKYIYGDDWSTDEEERAPEGNGQARRSSMYEELEEHLNKVFPISKMENTDSSEYQSSGSNGYGSPSEEVNEKLENLKIVPDCNDNKSANTAYTSRLPGTQPLYQIYMLEEQDKIIDEIKPGEASSTDRPSPETERTSKPCRRESSASSDSGRGADCSTSVSASALTSTTSLRRERLIATSHFGSQRSLWCELPEVKSAGLLDSLDEDSKQLQEAYFEVITSEASYLRSLNILITHFMADPELLGSKSQSSIITNEDRKHLFSNIFAVRDCSERLLCDLESRLEESLVLDDICDILFDHFENNFDAYVKYCSNQVYQDRTLRRLKTECTLFLTAVSRLESDKQCQGLDMRSFLMLPMQRVTRYPLLAYAILERLPMGSEKHKVAAKALLVANQLVFNCNEGARRMERTEQLLDVDRRLQYKDPDLKRLALVSTGRYLVKRGTIMELVERRSKGLLQSRQKARAIYVFLFSDLLLITKRKMNGTYVCKDYADRRYVDTAPIEPEDPKIPLGALQQLSSKPHLFSCILMKNARGRQSEILLSAESESDRERWLSAIRPPACANPEERIYADWDCPQAIVVHLFSKAQDDELDLAVGDMINILRKMPDGWFYGERARDSVGGWFPSSYVQMIVNDHTRANNYRQRLRLIQAATDLRAHQIAAVRAGATVRAPAIINKLRRMSNPKNIFTPPSL